jgi:hypothetical protein
MPNTPPDLTGDPGSPPLDGNDPGAAVPESSEAKPSITDLLKNPSKVVMCKVNLITLSSLKQILGSNTPSLVAIEYGRPRRS